MQNVLKCTFLFSHLHFKLSNCAIMTQNNFFLKISIWVTKNTDFYVDCKSVPTKTNAPKKSYSQETMNF